MKIAILTIDEILEFHNRLVKELTELFNNVKRDEKHWIKTADVRKLLGCSSKTIQNYRSNGILPFTKLGGTHYYDKGEVLKLLDDNLMKNNYGNNK